MADIGDQLRIKYGLSSNPSLELQKHWAAVTDILVGQGHPREQAGRMAAKQIFVGFDSIVYASESDTIEMLLDRLRDK